MDGHGADQPHASELPDEPWGDVPPAYQELPAVITVQTAINPRVLEADARTYLEQHGDLKARAQRLGHDIIAHRTELMIGAGLATTLGAIVLYRYGHRRRK